MGTAGNAAIRDLDPLEIINALNSFYAMEMVAMHFTLAVQNRLEGQALFLLNSELDEKAEEFRGHAKKLAERIGQLGGAVTADPSSFVEVSPFERPLAAKAGLTGKTPPPHPRQQLRGGHDPVLRLGTRARRHLGLQRIR